MNEILGIFFDKLESKILQTLSHSFFIFAWDKDKIVA